MPLVLAGALFLVAGFPALHAQSTVSTTPPDAAAPPPQDSAPAPAAPAKHKSSIPAPSPTSAETAAALVRLTEANQELLDLLKKQQAVLEDIQFDRRLQSRQISSLEDRLEESLQENSQLQAKISKLEEQISLGPATDTKSSPASASIPAPPKAVDAPPPAPSTYLPAPESAGAPDTKSWHRLFTLSGTDGKKSDLFKIEGRQWRVLWHNLDQPGDAYKNTSALFISAFPKDDTIPQNVCSKLGTGGDSTELNGPGEFYLKIEASGGSWELAVEDFK
jgi:regulator of replication initiation timing